MFVAKMKFDGNEFFIEKVEGLLSYDCEIPDRNEKNWAPFEYNRRLFLTYSIIPHRILEPLGQAGGGCKTFALTDGNIQWEWGDVRGGPALIVDGQYLAFFHSCKDMKTVQSDGKKITHYFMGAYTYSSNFPFAITGISKAPIVEKSFYTGPLYKTWKPLRVIFPDGFVFDDQFIWITYGRQDHELWIAKLDKQGLLNSLTPVLP